MKFTNKIFLNGDSSTYFYQEVYDRFQPDGGKYSASIIHRLIRELAASGVDTFVINGNTQRAWYPSNTLPRITEGYTRGDKNYISSHIPNTGIKTVDKDKIDMFLEQSVRFLNRYLDLEEAGIDWLRETTIACRKNKISPWISIRMNDTHGADAIESYFNCLLFRDPNMRINTPPVNLSESKPRCREGLNYLCPEVREYMLSMIREPVMDYDFDGIELDWMRDPICVSPPACRSDIETITNFFRQVRQITNSRARVAGKPFPISLRAPGSLNLLLDIGIDVRTLVREGIIDCFVPCNFFQTAWDMPFDELRRELGDNVTLLGSINSVAHWLRCGSSRDKKNYGYRHIGIDFARGNAAGQLVLGANGIEFFNCFYGGDEGNGLIRDIANIDGLRGKRKAYSLSSQFFIPTGTIPTERDEQFPCILEPDTRRTFRIPMCREPEDMSVTIQVIADRTEPLPEIGVALNGGWPVFQYEITSKLLADCDFNKKCYHNPNTYDILQEEQISFIFRFTTKRLREGWNEITLFNNAHITRDGVYNTFDGAISTTDRLIRSVRIRGIEILCM